MSDVTAGRKMCRHCGAKPVSRPRRTCWACYYTPGVRDLYPTVYSDRFGKAFGMPTVEDFNGPAPLPEPDPALLPGSEAKIAAMAERAGRRQSLFHPDEPRQKKGRNPAVKGGQFPGFLVPAFRHLGWVDPRSLLSASLYSHPGGGDRL